MEEARLSQEKAKLEDLSIVPGPLTKITKKGERREYLRWISYWQEKGKRRKVYLGSCNKMTQDEALAKARKMKAESLSMRKIFKPRSIHKMH
jgi:hypothetical protein